jgi:hypothetical protein
MAYSNTAVAHHQGLRQLRSHMLLKDQSNQQPMHEHKQRWGCGMPDACSKARLINFSKPSHGIESGWLGSARHAHTKTPREGKDSVGVHHISN